MFSYIYIYIEVYIHTVICNCMCDSTLAMQDAPPGTSAAPGRARCASPVSTAPSWLNTFTGSPITLSEGIYHLNYHTRDV